MGGMGVMPKLNALWRVPLILAGTAVLASVSVFFSIFDGTGRLQHACAQAWGKFIIGVSRVRVRVEGLERLDTSRGYVFMANHLSMFDHWAFLAELPFQFRFAAKASLFKIPFLGWHLRRAGNIPVDRHNPRKTLRDFQAIGEKISQGLSLVIYPEGGRTWGDALLEFKRGPFMLATQAHAPIVPVTIIGAHRRLARGSAVIYPGTMELILHEVIEYADYRDLSLDELSSRVRGVIESRYRQVPL